MSVSFEGQLNMFSRYKEDVTAITTINKGSVPMYAEAAMRNIGLIGIGGIKYNYSIKSATIAEFNDSTDVQHTLTSLEKTSDFYTVRYLPNTPGAVASMRFTFGGLEVGTAYNLIINQGAMYTGGTFTHGSFSVLDSNGNSLGSIMPTDDTVDLLETSCVRFTATTNTITVVVVPYHGVSYAGSYTCFNDLYLNHADTTFEHTDIYEDSSSFTANIYHLNVPAKSVIKASSASVKVVEHKVNRDVIPGGFYNVAIDGEHFLQLDTRIGFSSMSGVDKIMRCRAAEVTAEDGPRYSIVPQVYTDGKWLDIEYSSGSSGIGKADKVLYQCLAEF